MPIRGRRSALAPALRVRKIADALKADDVASADLSNLIEETEAAVATADEAAIEARERALDPIASPDATKARAAMEDAAFTRDRLRTVLPRLQHKFERVRSQEAYDRWVIDFEKVKAKHDAAVADLRETYPAVVTQLVDLLTRIEEVDREVRRVSAAKPLDRSDDRRLKEVELTARGLEHFGFYGHSLIKDMKLPDFSEPTKLAWPPPTVPLGVQMALSMASMIRPHPGANWAAEADERHRQRREEGERMADHYNGMAKQRKEREAKEREEAEPTLSV